MAGGLFPSFRPGAMRNYSFSFYRTFWKGYHRKTGHTRQLLPYVKLGDVNKGRLFSQSKHTQPARSVNIKPFRTANMALWHVINYEVLRCGTILWWAWNNKGSNWRFPWWQRMCQWGHRRQTHFFREGKGKSQAKASALGPLLMKLIVVCPREP